MTQTREVPPPRDTSLSVQQRTIIDLNNQIRALQGQVTALERRVAALEARA